MASRRRSRSGDPRDCAADCEWYDISSARGSLGEAPCNLATPRRCQTDSIPLATTSEETTASVRPLLPPLPSTLCPGGRGQGASRESSISVTESGTTLSHVDFLGHDAPDDPRGSRRGSCIGSEAGTATTQDPTQVSCEKRASDVDERQAELFKKQWGFVHENMQALSKEVALLRDDFQVLTLPAVTEKVQGQEQAPVTDMTQFKLDLVQEAELRCAAEERLESMIVDVKQGLEDRVHDVRDMLVGKRCADGVELPCNDLHSLNVSLNSEIPVFTDRLAALEQQLSSAHGDCLFMVEERIAAESAHWAETMTEVATQFQSMLYELDKEGKCRIAGDKENARLISHTCQSLEKALGQERQERQCMCSLVAQQSSTAIGKPDQGAEDLALHEALSGLFASVGSLQEALGREAELRVSSCEELETRFRDESGKLVDEAISKAGWDAELQRVWAILKDHTHDVQLEADASGRSASPQLRHAPRDKKLLAPPTESKQRIKNDAMAAAALQYARQMSDPRSRTPSSVSHSSSQAALARSPVRKADPDSHVRSSPPCMHHDPEMAVLLELGGPSPAKKIA